MDKKVEVTIKRVSSNEPNVSKRHTSYDVYHNGKYHTTFNDINDALDHKEKMQKEELEIDEAVLSVAQRQKRAQIMRRYQAKIERAREIAKKRLAPQENIKKRAYAQARHIVRQRVAGKRGAEYEKLGPSEKIAIDRAVEGKQKLIKKIALRLIPRVKSAEQQRLHAFMKGQSLQNHGQPEGKTQEGGSGHSSVREEFNQMFAESFPPMAERSERKQPKETTDTVARKKGGKEVRGNKNVIQYSKFEEERDCNSSAYKAIAKKANKSGISEDTLGEVYDRGMEAWYEETGVSQQQYAFARVNSYINQGKTYFNEDADLHEGTMKPYVKPHYGNPNKPDQQTGWKSANKHGKTKYWQMFAKNSAEKHAGINEETGPSYKDELPHILKDIRGKRKNQSDLRREYGSNWKRLANATSAEHGPDYKREHLLAVGKQHMEEEVQQTNENFIDGKGPGKPGDASRHGLKGKSAAELRKIRSSETASPRKKQLAHWMLNMHHNEETEIQELSATTINAYRRGMERDVAMNPEMDPKKKERRLKGFKTSTDKVLGVAKVNVKEGLKDPEDNPCWKGYKPVGTKKKAGKTVPNCVPVNEEERPDPKAKVEGTNCRNCVYWRKDLEKPVTKEELNPNGGLKAPNKEYIEMSKRIDLGTLPGKDSGVKIKGFCDHDSIKDWVTERMCCSQWDSDGMIRDYKGQSPVMEAEGESILPQTTSPGSKIRKKLEVVDRKPPHTEYTRQAEIKTKVIDEEGNSQPDPKKRLVGTDSLVKAYKKDTPGQSLDESFNIAFASGVGVTLTARDLGMQTQGGFALHPSVIEEMERRAAEEMEEEVRSADVKGVVVRTASGKTVVRKQKVDRKIIGSGNLTDGKPDDTL